jgi:phage protein D
MAAAAIRREAPGPPVAQPAQVDSRASALQQPHSQHEHHSQLQQQQQQQQQHNQQQQQQESKFGDEGELLRLRQQRLRQLQAQSAAKQEQQREGYGTLNTVPEGSVMVRRGGAEVLGLCWNSGGSSLNA